MSLKRQKISIDAEEFNANDAANDENPKQLLGRRPGSPTSPYQQPVEIMPDQEYVRMMEERYGIREEGIF